MSKKLLWALILIAGVVILLLLNTRSSAAVSLSFADLRASRAVIYFSFTAIGVVIGLLLK